MLAPAAAHAESLEANAVLPPGQSGFVSLAGVASGTGSPHLPFFDRRTWEQSVMLGP